jgi:hypothetical protein
MINYAQVGPNKYRKGLFDVTVDFCKFAGGANDYRQFIKLFWPDMRERMVSLLHPCPYTVGHILLNNKLNSKRNKID